MTTPLQHAPPSLVEGLNRDHAQFEFAYQMTTPIWVFDIDASRILFANASACRVWQAETEVELQARDLSQGMSSTVQKRLLQYQTDFAENETFNEIWTVYPNGEPVSLDVHYSGFRRDNGRFAMLCEAQLPKDTTPDNLRSAEALLHTDVMIALFHRDGQPLYLNPAARNAVLGADQGLGDLFVDRRDHTSLFFELDRCGEHSQVSKIYTNSGLRWYDITAKLCADAATGVPAVLVTASDVSDLKIARDQARFLAQRDQLTGCFNRNYLKQIVHDLARFTPQACALLFFDIDRFKQINDSFGHEMGDSVLKELATRAQDTLTKLDVLVRLGGDEFVVLYRDVEDETSLLSRAERLLEALRAPFQSTTVRLNPTVSIGLTFFQPGQQTLTSAMSEADIALYASKVDGRNRLTLFSDALGAAAKARNQIEVDLKSAIERGEFILHFQPRVDFATQKIVSAEALVRWEHPTRGQVPPNDFIPVCEETGLIEQVGQIILESGLEQMTTWQRSGLDLDLSINISPRQFESRELIETLGRFAADPNFPSHRVELEITENVLIGNVEQLAAQLQQISELGYRIAIDDFGVGYSNLSYVSTFPVNCIKIDRSFISQLPASGPVIGLILALARQIGARTVAEGVETEDQAAWLAAQTCDEAQGFWFHRPMPLDALEAMCARPSP
ncbi:MAG: putative bifunctional diguanylate cyclase/phosphodiesterase [Paracoccaceae bacterium]